MKVILYKGTRPGWAGIGNWAVRKRTKSIYSHCEIVFEETDTEAAFAMPDGTVAKDDKNALWCFSATASDRMPAWSDERRKRAGKIGGTRFKRITIDPDHWDVIDVPYADAKKIAQFCLDQEGKAYDWRHIFSFFSVILIGFIINLYMHQGENHWTCAEITGACLDYSLPEIFDPKTLGAVATTALMVWNKAKASQ